MKHTNIYLRLVVACLLIWTGVEDVCGQLSASGTWNATEVKTTQTVELTGNVTMNGKVTIANGVKLTINGNNKKITTYTTSTDGATDLLSFEIKAGGKLVMSNVTLDGGNPSTKKVGNTYDGGSEGAVGAGADFTKFGTAIVVYDNAILELTNVNACNLSNRNYAAFIYAVDGDGVLSSAATITMTNVNVDNCLSKNDNGIIYTGGALMASNISLNNCQITNCMVKANDTGTGYGGVIKGAGSTNCQLTMTGCTMSYCWGSGWGGAILWAASGPGAIAKFENCTFNNNYARYLGGAISTEATIELTGCKIYDNVAGFGGGGIAAFPFTLSTTTNIIPNIGLNLKEGNQIYQNKTLFVTNIDGSNVTKDCNKESETQTITQENPKGFNPRYTLLNATDVWYPSGGGGIYILMNKDGWNANMDFSASGNQIYDNESASEGGGIYVYKQIPYRSAVEGESNYVKDQEKVTFLTDYTSPTGQTSMELAANISNNKAASSGGGVSVGAEDNTSSTSWTYPSVTVSGGKIEGNTASNGNGGGVYMPGGAFTIEGGSIENNKAKVAERSTAGSLSGNGGGIAITNGTFTISSPKFEISENEADHYGGGLYVSNTKSTNIAFTGGTFTSNSAYAGGGACVDGPVTLTVTNSNFESNTAKVGGGICLTGGTSSTKATMTYNSGRIRNNTANASNNDTGITGGKPTSFTTAYLQGISSGLEGIGGGVFLDSYSSLTFGGNTDTPIGLYGNLAYNGADDIFANGLGTSVHLPNVTGMQLADFKVPVDPEFLYWVKDYITDDTDYSNAPKMTDEDAYTGNAGVKRYRYALGSMSEDDLYWKLSPDTYTGYVSVALGYEVIYATINKYGLDLDKGENSIFTLTQGTDEKPYMRMVVSKENAVTNSTGETYISKRIALPAGTWTIAETSWSWAYDLTLPDDLGKNDDKISYTRKLTQVTTKENGNVAVFNFKNTKKTGTTELRMENIKVNKMKASTSGN